MKVAILSESSADEAAVRILLEGLLGRETESVATPPLRTRGWPSILDVFPIVLKHLYYSTDADALVVVADSNHASLSPPGPEGPVAIGGKCRLSPLREAAERTLRQLRPIAGRSRIRIGIGIAVLAIEAWYRCGHDPTVTEAAWLGALGSRRYPYSKNSLKQAVYGTDRPSLELETRHAIEETRRLTSNLALLEQRFPIGFGSLARDVRTWLTIEETPSV
jgi:hypothetical protein